MAFGTGVWVLHMGVSFVTKLTPPVRKLSDRFKMLRVDASANPTEMVNVISRRYFTVPREI